MIEIFSFLITSYMIQLLCVICALWLNETNKWFVTKHEFFIWLIPFYMPILLIIEKVNQIGNNSIEK